MKSSVFKKAGEKSLEYAARFGAQKHLTILRDAFALLTPLLIAGALAVLVRSFVFGGAGATQTSILGWIAYGSDNIAYDKNGEWIFIAGSGFEKASTIGNFLFYGISHATIDAMSIYLAFGIGYFLSNVRKSKDPVIAGLVSLMSFFIAILVNPAFLGPQGILTAIIVGILATELFCIFERSERIKLKMPAGVPPAVSRSFSKLFPMMFVSLIVMSLNLPFILFGYLLEVAPGQEFTLGQAIYLGIQSPFISLVGNDSFGFGLAFMYAFMVGLIWFFGIHGTNVLMGVFSPIFLALYGENVNGAEHIFVQGTFDAFVFIGGTGATLAWIVAVFAFSRNKSDRELAKLSVGPGIFQINEPIIFGLPMVLNVRYFIPYVLSMPILTVTTWIGFNLFNIHQVDVLIPWTTPVGVGGLLATSMDYKGFILAIINFAIAFGIWTPFIFLFSRNKDGSDKLMDIENRIEEEKQAMKDKSAGKRKATLTREEK